MLDANKEEQFELRAKLARVRVDSRALRQTLAAAEAGARCGCFLCKGLGSNNAFVRYVRPETTNPIEDEVEDGDSDEEGSDYSSDDVDDDNDVENFFLCRRRGKVRSKLQQRSRQ